MDLSHSVDDVVKRNLAGIENVGVIQCSIDAPPLRSQSIDGIVYCHNVIQLTPSVEKTAHALYELTAPGGGVCIQLLWAQRSGCGAVGALHLVYKPLRAVLSRMPFTVIMFYARLMAILRLVPGLGVLLENQVFV